MYCEEVKNELFITLGTPKMYLKFRTLIQTTVSTKSISSRPAIERPGLESQRSRKRLFFHRKIFQFFKY